MKVYYDATQNKEVVDVSGKKSLQEIAVEHGLSNETQVVTLAKNEAIKNTNGVITKFNLIDERAAKRSERKSSKDASISRLKSKLKLDDDGWADLVTALQ